MPAAVGAAAEGAGKKPVSDPSADLQAAPNTKIQTTAATYMSIDAERLLMQLPCLPQIEKCAKCSCEPPITARATLNGWAGLQ